MTFYGFHFSMTADVSIILWLTTIDLRPPLRQPQSVKLFTATF